MSRLPLLEGVLKYIKEDNSCFCMPGHKAGKGFLIDDIGRTFLEKLAKFDVTEVAGLDNLHSPEGIIKEAEKLLSEYYGSQKSYFLVNGSTSGNLSMIFSSFNEGDKVIVERNCHRSIFNAIIMRKLRPVYVKNKVNEKYNAPLSLDMEHFLLTIKENKDAKGIIITYPNYYGICADLKAIIKTAKRYKMMVLVDSAHGAHFGVHENLPKQALSLGADMVVMSSHKTLASFTQTAYLHVGKGIDLKKVDFYVSAFLSTSPSYILMCSMDYARYYLEKYGFIEYEKLIKLSLYYSEKINKLEKFHVITPKDIGQTLTTMDITRFIINVGKGYSGHKLLAYLRNKKIQCEMSDSENVVLIFSPSNNRDEFEKLYRVLEGCDKTLLKENYKEIMLSEIPFMKLLPYEAILKDNIEVKLVDAKGKISGKSIVPYPPGIPLVMPGEIISSDVIDVIKYNIDNNVDIVGFNKEEMSLSIVQ
ncbi:aminotransferase class I/II-fold pyridoxal phosphate-dependent enzyme [Haloimpatiens sp. FM7315]|uniref:aminotransferase class I/II-fold pyridoxal phosphate-dependent enzyme n=1 Tax=Haloimpatiens sp. FM7315 TaxID=3298609 RepID=UPI0035A269D4